jgi:DNA-binding phage protein
MDWPQALDRLRDDRGNWERIARETGLAGNHVRRLAQGNTTRPRIDTVDKIIAYYQRQQEAAA